MYLIAIVFCLLLPNGKCCESGTGALRRYDKYHWEHNPLLGWTKGYVTLL